MDVTFVIMGATGDLTKRKLLSAMYRLIANKKLDKCIIVGVARRNTTMKKIIAQAKKFSKENDKKIWKKIEAASYYHQLDFYNKADYKKLGEHLTAVEEKNGLVGNRIFYLATLPQHFDVITSALAATGIAKETKKRWSKVVYEKPFGNDLKSARKINLCINRVFNEKQIYRIDHYLGKELVGNISIMRFTNRVLEPLWSRNHLEQVQIILNEDFGVEGRGAFYDQNGAIKDVIQNHGLQLLALIAMEAPRMLTGEYIRDEKVKVLNKTKAVRVLRGQYVGYTKEKGVRSNSKTETFTTLQLAVNNPRWRGVPFFIKAGKNLDKREASIHLKFKHVKCALTAQCPSDTNYLSITIQPNEGITLELNAKLPGAQYAIKTVKMHFCQVCEFGPGTPESYETLLDEIIKGNQSVFVRNDEIEQAWRIIDSIKKGPVYSYKKGSTGPKQLSAWNDIVRWRA